MGAQRRRDFFQFVTGRNHITEAKPALRGFEVQTVGMAKIVLHLAHQR